MSDGPPTGSRLDTVPRLSWDEYFLSIAARVASRSTCDRLHVGCVVVRDRAILSTGYNGAPRGLAHCDDIGHLMIDESCKRTVHAETNAIAQAAMNGTALVGATLYCTHHPCLACSLVIINAGISRVVYEMSYRPDPIVTDCFALSGVLLEKVHS